jgi:hypothetical protein
MIHSNIICLVDRKEGFNEITSINMKVRFKSIEYENKSKSKEAKVVLG